MIKPIRSQFSRKTLHLSWEKNKGTAKALSHRIKPRLEFFDFFLLSLNNFRKHSDHIHRTEAVPFFSGQQIGNIFSNNP